MNNAERIGALISNEKLDRVPVVCILLDQGAKELGMSIQEYYSKGEYIAEGQIKMQERYGYDVVWGFSYMGYLARMLGCKKIIFSESGPPNVGHMILRNEKDIESFWAPGTLDDIPIFNEIIKAISLLNKHYDGTCPVASPTISSFTLPSILMGIEKWMELLFTGPGELVTHMLEQCHIFCVKHIKTLRDAGAALIPYASPMASVDMITLEQFQKMALPWIIKDIEAAGWNNIIYFNGGGRINPTIKDLLEHTDIKAFYLNPLDSIKEARSIAGEEGIFCGVINDIKLINWESDRIEGEVKRIMKEGKEAGRFAFGTLVMPYAIPESHITDMLAAAFKYGTYDAWN